MERIKELIKLLDKEGISLEESSYSPNNYDTEYVFNCPNIAEDNQSDVNLRIIINDSLIYTALTHGTIIILRYEKRIDWSDASTNFNSLFQHFIDITLKFKNRASYLMSAV